MTKTFMVEQKFWFKAHRSGYGWSPNTWQGWTTIVLYIVAVVYSFIASNNHTGETSDILINFLPRVLFFSAVLISITYLKGEPVTWYWKGKKKEMPHSPPVDPKA